jgi:hypothetical protein
MKILAFLLVVALLAALFLSVYAEDEELEKAKKKAKSKAKPKANKKATGLRCTKKGYQPGKCIDNTKKCCPKGTKFVDGDLCPGQSGNPRVVCCAKKLKKGQKPPKPKPKKKKSKPKNKKGWGREDCALVANAWVKHKVMYSQSKYVKQFVTKGSKKYRQDCSGFVAACWNAPLGKWGGFNTDSATYNKVGAAKNLKQCDAVLWNPPGIKGHMALFWGWAKDGRPIMIEEYSTGKPATRRPWNYNELARYKLIRRKGW